MCFGLYGRRYSPQPHQYYTPMPLSPDHKPAKPQQQASPQAPHVAAREKRMELMAQRRELMAQRMAQRRERCRDAAHMRRTGRPPPKPLDDEKKKDEPRTIMVLEKVQDDDGRMYWQEVAPQPKPEPPKPILVPAYYAMRPPWWR